VGWGPLCDYNIARILHDCNTVGIEQLSIAFSTFPKLELESALFVEYLKIRLDGNQHF